MWVLHLRLLHLKKYLLCTLLILKRIKFAKQRRKRICWIRKVRSSRSQMLLNIAVLENFANIKVKYLTQVFSYEICEVFKNTIFYRPPPVAASGKSI